jgi:hypothetical protein
MKKYKWLTVFYSLQPHHCVIPSLNWCRAWHCKVKVNSNCKGSQSAGCTRLRSAIGRCSGQGRLRALYPFWCAVYKSTLEKEPHFLCAIHWACIWPVLFNNWQWTGFNNTLKVGLESLKHVGYLLQFISDPKSTIQRQKKSDPSVSLKEKGKSHLAK